MALDVPDPSQLTVRQFLDQISTRIPQARLTYRYAWYEGRWIWIWLSAGFAAALLGVLCPAALWAVASRSIGSKSLNAITAPPAVSAPSAEVEPRPPEHSQPVAQDAIRSLGGGKLTPLVSSPRKEGRYAGQYYPTQAHASRSDPPA